MEKLEHRKKDHIELAFKSQTLSVERDPRFYYEPLLSAHPDGTLDPLPFLGKTLRCPLWVSSMTGGTQLAGTINRNLARACREFGMGMGLGSCRSLLYSSEHLDDFKIREIIGDEQSLWANLGIAQIEKMLEDKEVARVEDLVHTLEADGLIIHVNPMQEWFQMEGDVLHRSPIESIGEFTEAFSLPLIVKEVGQGMGPESLRQLLQLPLQAIEFAAFGGTNFARVEMLRDESKDKDLFTPLSTVGEDAPAMLDYVNALVEKEKPRCEEIIISGGVRSFMDGYYLMKKSRMPAIYGMASAFLKHAREGYEPLRAFVQGQVKGLAMAHAYLRIRES